MSWRDLADHPEYRRECRRSRLLRRGIYAVAASTLGISLVRSVLEVVADAGAPLFLHMAARLPYLLILLPIVLPPLILALALTQARESGTGEMLLLTGHPPSRWLMARVAAYARPLLALAAALAIPLALEGALPHRAGSLTPSVPTLFAWATLSLCIPLFGLVSVSATIESLRQWRSTVAIVGIAFLRLFLIALVATVLVSAGAGFAAAFERTWAPLVLLAVAVIAGHLVARRQWSATLARFDAQADDILAPEPVELPPYEPAAFEPQPVVPGCLFLFLGYATFAMAWPKWEVVPVLHALSAAFVYWDARACGLRRPESGGGLFGMSAGQWSFLCWMLPFVSIGLYVVARNDRRIRLGKPAFLIAALALAGLELAGGIVSAAMGRGLMCPLR